MSKKKLMLFVAIMMCLSLIVAAFVGCDDKPQTTVYKVTFESNGGSEVAAVEGAVAEEPAPVRDGYVFAGWFADQDCSGDRITFPYTPTADVTLYAKWNVDEEDGDGDGDDQTPNFNIVTFDSNGGSAVSQVIGVVEKEPIPTKQDCTFDGWYTTASLNGSRVSFPYTPVKNTKLYAKWIVDFDMSIALNSIMKGLRAQTKFDASEAFGISVAADIADIGLSFAMNVNPNNASDVRVRLNVENKGTNVVSLYADDVNMYAVSPQGNKRFVNVNLAGFIKDADFASPDDMTYALISSVLNAVFTGGEATREGEVYTLTGSLSGAISLIKLLGLDIPQEILDIISQLEVTAVADMSGGALNSLNVALGVQGIGAGINMTELKIANAYAPVDDVPAKDAAGFDESYALNFTLEGSVSLGKNNADYTKSQLVNMTYELRVDYNIFEALRNCITYAEDGTMIFDASQLFNTSDSRIYLDVYHQCNENCTEFCAGKNASSRGSFLTLAYSPEDFGNTDLRAAINVKYLLPQGWVESLVGDLPINILNLLKEYTGINIDPAALILQNNVIENENGLALAGGASVLPEGMNILDIIFDVADFARTVYLTEADGLRIGVAELLDVVDDLTPLTGGTNIANLIAPFFGEADYIDFKVDKAIYGDPETTTIDIYREYMIISDNVGDYKEFGSFSKDIDWVRGNDGNVIITSGNISTHDDNGDPVKLTEYEIRELITSGEVKYTYTDIYGNVAVNAKATDVLKVNGLDFNIYDQPQTVRMVTDLVDGGSISSLLNMASIAGISVQIPSGVFTTNITISSIKDIEFYQPAEVDDGKGGMVSNNPYDENKVYKYGDSLNQQFIAKITFADDSVREEIVEPTFTDNPFSGKGNKATIAYFGSFDMVYEAYGQTFTKHVQMADQFIANEAIEAEVKTGEPYSISKSMKIKYNTLDEQGTVKDLTVYGNSDIMKDIDVEGVTVETTSSGINLIFEKAGRYEIRVKNSKNIYQDYVFNVTEKKVCPGYKAVVQQELDNAGVFKVDVSRSDQYGDGIKAAVKVELNNKEGVLTTLTEEDYYLYELVNGEEVKLDELYFESFMPAGYTFYIKVTNEEYIPANTVKTVGKISVIAPDYDNSVIVEQDLDRTVYYSMTIGNELIESTTGLYTGTLVAISPVCPDEMKISGVKFDHKITITVGEEVIELTSSDYKFNNIDSEGKVGFASFNFSADGKASGKTLCLRIVNEEIRQKIAAAENVSISYVVTASNYDNVELASAEAVLKEKAE